MRYSVYLFFVAALLFSACSSQRAGRIENANQISMITISRTPCFGTCPVYTMQIDKNCVVTLDAVDHLPNKMKGWYKANLPEKEWMVLVNKLEKMNFKDMQDDYGNRQITDLPSVNTAITFADGNAKKINDYGARGTQELSELYTYVDALIGLLDWESTDQK